MKIETVRRYKGSTFSVGLEDGRTIYLNADTITDFEIVQGMEVSREELKEIIYSSNFRRSYQYALYCLDYRDYSAKEMYEKLLDKYKSERLCRAVVEKLKESSIIDDERYAERLARRFAEVKKYGYRRSLREIMQKGIDEFTAEDALEPYIGLSEENLQYLIKSRYSRYLEDETDRKSIERAKRGLVTLGYTFDEINTAIKKYFNNIK